MIPLKNSPEPSTKCMGSSPGGRLEPYVRSSKPHLTTKRDFPGNSAGKKKISLQCRRPGFDPWVGKIPWRRKEPPPSLFLPEESPWTEEPGGLQSMGLQKVGYNWATKHSTVMKKTSLQCVSSSSLEIFKNRQPGLPWWLSGSSSANV